MNMEKTRHYNKKNKISPVVKDFKGTWIKLLKYLSMYKSSIFVSTILSVTSAIISIFSPKLSGQIINFLSEGITSGLVGGGIDFESITKIVVTLFIMYSGSAMASCLSDYINTNISVETTYRMRKEMSEKINRLPLAYFDTVTYGEVISRITNDIDVLVSLLTQAVSKILSSIVMLSGIVWMMFSISWEMSLISFSVLPVSFILISIVFRMSRRYFHQYQKQLGLINGHIEEAYSGHSVIKAFNGERTSMQTFCNINDKMFNLAWKSEFISGLISPVMLVVSSLSYIGLCVMGGYLAFSHGLAIGSIFAFLAYSNQFTSPLMSVAGISGTLQQVSVAAERVFEFMQENKNPQDNENCITISNFNENNATSNSVHIKGDVEFENVVFGYKEEKKIINNFSLKIHAGQTVAIVGPTGAGKTTILKLLTRLYDPQEGDIFIDGHNIKKLKRNDLNSLFGVVFQKPWLFSDTVEENIRYGKINSSNSDVRNVSKLAHSDGFIESLPEGYNTVINELADNISYGEKQLITIARTILSDYSILILDEATSSVDTTTELKIQEAIKPLLNRRTSFIVAHRLSTIRSADIIVFIDNGIILEVGNHGELLEKQGHYHKMYMSQFKNISNT